MRARHDGAGQDFATFVEAHGQRLQRLSFLLTSGDGPVAEDLLHTVLLRLQERGIGDLEEPASYARRALINEYTSHRRRTERDRRMRTRLVAVSRTTIDPRPEDRLAIFAALRGLGAKERTAVVLRYYEDLADVDIAAVLFAVDGAIADPSRDAETSSGAGRHRGRRSGEEEQWLTTSTNGCVSNCSRPQVWLPSFTGTRSRRRPGAHSVGVDGCYRWPWPPQSC